MHPAILAYLTDDVPRKMSWEKPKKAATPVAEAKPEKGYCRYCGDRIGRGVAFHERACPERPE